MPQKKRPAARRRKKRVSRFEKMIPYVIVGIFTYTLYATQFFHFFYDSQREAQRSHFHQETEVNFLFNFSTPQDVMELAGNLQLYFAQLMTGVDMNQLFSFLDDGLGFNGIMGRDRPARPHQGEPGQPEGFRFTRVPQVREDNLRYDPETFGPIAPRPPSDPSRPLIFVYNSHPWENVGQPHAHSRACEDFRCLNVEEMGQWFVDTFNDNGLPAIFQHRSPWEVSLERRWDASARAYDASRVVVEEAIAQYDSLNFFFDIHRDSPGAAITEVVLDGRQYARIMMVIGTRNPYMDQNLAIAEEITQRLEEKRPGITRPVRFLGGVRHNGLYNQDLSAGAQLFEIGGYESTRESASNSMEVLAEVLMEMIWENDWD